VNGSEELLALPGELGVDSLLVTDPANVRYLSGFTTPNDGRVLVTPERAWLITDARYEAQAAQESRLDNEIRRDWLPWVADRAATGRLGVEADALTLAQFEDLCSRLAGTPVPLRELLRDRRMVKQAHEITSLRRAARITDDAFTHVLGFIRAGISEAEVALELERFMRVGGAEGKSFDIVVASGVRSAMPHGVASAKRLEPGDLVTLDFGATVDGYHADMTRAVAIGEIDEDLRAMYDAVLEAQQVSLAAVAPGVTGSELDRLAHTVLARHGLEQYFAHSLGHGVGLQIHEGPKLSKDSHDTLVPGMTVTVEPGVYVPGRGGVRIEDLALVTHQGHERLSLSPKELISV
jgi:Xaa-Pro aminopeptidase